jgi:flavin reductase (DIM6/NTAB) family NADH-FMN oxidoreductase RutF
VGIDKNTFRAVMGSFAAGVTIVTCRDSAGSPKGFTATGIASLSLDPPLLLVCVDHRSDTLPAMQEATAFTVNMLKHGQEEISARFASKGIDKFAALSYSEGSLGTPILDDVLAYAECTVEVKYPGGDHTIFVGRIEHAAAFEGDPLLYLKGSYGRFEPNPKV